jgi:hypothetical protein
LQADASNISFESIKCWQLEHDLIYFEFSFWVQIIHKTYEFSHLDKLLEIHARELGGARILFVGITSYLNQWSEKDKFKPCRHWACLQANCWFQHMIFLHIIRAAFMWCGTKPQNNKSFLLNWKLIGDFISSYSLKCVWAIKVVTACFCPNCICCTDLSSITLLVRFQRT